MQSLLKKLLRFLAVNILARYRPRIVAVAGSVGKTSTVRAVTAALGRSFDVRGSVKNFNNEIGVPLAIIGAAASGGRSPLRWAAIIWRGLRLIYGRAAVYPAVLVLEMAVDHPGDMAYLTSLAPPDVAVMTALSEEHTEFLGDLDGVAKEEGVIIESLRPGGVAVLNADDPRVAALAVRATSSAVKIARYGFSSEAEVCIGEVSTEEAMGVFFTRFDLTAAGRAMTITLSGAIGGGNVYAAAAASAAALALGVKPELIPFSLAEYQPPPGRLRPLPGVKGTMLIDDTYNSSPRAAELALETFSNMKTSGKRLAALGDMLELGALTEESHRRVGRKAADLGVDVLIGVGPRSQFLCEEAIKAGLSEDRVFHLHTAEEAGHFLQERIRSGDLILIKGSQGMRMEKVAKELMAEPERAAELLVRQTEEWL